MSDAVLLDSLVPKREPKRNRYGQYLIPDRITGQETAYQRATTLARILADTYNLDLWQKRMTAKGLALRPDLFAQVAAASLDEKPLLDTICEQAAEAAGATEGRNVGSALHRFTQRINAGEDVIVPAPWDSDVAAYQQALVDAAIAPVPNMAERIVVVPSIGVAGTFDNELQSPRWIKTRIGDLKSAQKIWGWLEIAIQLAVYAHGDSTWDLDTEAHMPMPDVDQDVAIVMHVPAGTGACTLYEVNIAAGWEAAQLAVEVRELRKCKTFAVQFGQDAIALPPSEQNGNGPAPDGGLRAEHARQRVIKLANADAAIAWPTNVPTFRQARETGHVHTVVELDAIDTALSAAEAAVDAPFDDGPPLADQPRVDAIIGRLAVLPADVLRNAEQLAHASLVPNLRSGRINVAHCDLLEQLLPKHENIAAQRINRANETLGEYAADPAIVAAILATLGVTRLGECTDDKVVALEAVCTAIDSSVLVLMFDDDGTGRLDVGETAEAAIVAAGGGKKPDAIVFAKDVAERHGIKRPRSVPAITADPLLTALVVHAARQTVTA